MREMCQTEHGTMYDGWKRKRGGWGIIQEKEAERVEQQQVLLVRLEVQL